MYENAKKYNIILISTLHNKHPYKFILTTYVSAQIMYLLSIILQKRLPRFGIIKFLLHNKNIHMKNQ